MDFKKVAPWNWFKHDKGYSGTPVPVRHADQETFFSPSGSPYQEVDHLFDSLCGGFGYSPFRTGSFFPGSIGDVYLKPDPDLIESDLEYTINIDVPGVDEKDITLEISNNILTVTGEKIQEKRGRGQHYFRRERSHGSFQRVLSFPDDADQNEVTATFENGVLTINMPKKAIPGPAMKRIEIH